MASGKKVGEPANASNDEGTEALTQLLREAREGDTGASNRAYELIYRRLHEAARKQLSHRSGRGLLTPTALVNEAWLKLASANFEIRDREHYVALASRAMRQIVVDAARAASSEKRGGEAVHVTLTDVEAALTHEADVLRLDEALKHLENLDARLAQVVLYRYFAGLNEAEVASLLGVTDRTVRRDWRKARAFLHRELQESA
ncbi:MAG: sigma-70 family RNA polymerase sigma factor [Deltaproteobacteria bacterium]|nr:sigma-70 family RNA polymerase sigma factor [Deltaproteobacteria bacterium]